MGEEIKAGGESLESKIDRAMKMLADDFDWDAYYRADEDGTPDDDIFRRCIAEDDPEGEFASPLAQVGSRRVEDPARALYRLLYLARPKTVDFSDMYKSGTLFWVVSADGRYAVSVAFWKYELALYFLAPKDTIPPKVVHGPFDIQTGIPGADNGWRTTDPVATKFFELVCRAADREWVLYSGNDFKV